MTQHDAKSLFGQATYICGFAGVAMIVLGSLVSGLSYRGRTDEPYSLLNHFVSELGDARYAPRAWAFNGGLLLGGVLLTVFMLGVTARIRGWYRYPFGLASLITGIAGTLVGLLPMGNGLESHAKAAMTFFNAGMATTILFSLYVLLWRETSFSRWLALPGGVTAFSFFSLLYLVEPLIPEDQPDMPLVEALEALLWSRPAVWQTAIVEWIVVLAVLGWVVAVSLYLRQAESQARSTLPCRA